MSRPLPQFLPPLLDPEGRQRPRPRPVLAGRALRPPPLPKLTSARTGCALYSFSHITRQGRITLSGVSAALGWPPQTSLAVSIVDLAVVFKPSAAGSMVFDRPGRLWLPALIRRRLALTAGTGVLLVADPAQGLLVVCPPACLDQMTARISDQKGIAG